MTRNYPNNPLRYRSKYDDTKVSAHRTTPAPANRRDIPLTACSAQVDILEAVFAILQEAGQALVTGWPTVLFAD